MSIQLLKLAQKKFGKLNIAHQRLYRGITQRDIICYSSDQDEENDPIRFAEVIV